MTSAGPSKEATRGNPWRLAALLALAVLLAAAALWARARYSTPRTDIGTLVSDVARDPASVSARTALAKYLSDRGLNFGVGLELSLLPPGSPREIRIAAAEAWVKQGLPERALPIYQGLLDRGADPAVAARLAAVQRGMGEFTAALATIDQARSVTPDSGMLKRVRLHALMDVADYDTVLLEVRPLLLARPGDGELRTLAAWTELLRGNGKEAAALLAAMPRPAPAWVELIYARSRLSLGGPGDISAARTSFEAAAGADPQLFEARLGLAQCAVKAGQWEQAGSHARAAAQLQEHSPEPWRIMARAAAALPDPAESLYCRGRAAIAAETPQEALSLIRKAVALRAGPAYLESLAQATRFAAGPRAAMDSLRARCRANGEPELLRLWYEIAFQERDLEQAEEAARKLAANPRPEIAAEGHARVAETLRQKRDYAGAIAAAGRSLELVPDAPPVLSERASALLEEGADPQRLPRAEADLARVAALAAPVPPAYYQMAVADLEQGRRAEAFEHLLRNLTMLGDEGLDVPLSLLAKTCTLLGLRPEAAEAAEWAADLRRKADAIRATTVLRPTPGRDRILAETYLGLHDNLAARAACLRLTRAEPDRREHFLLLAKACQRLALYDERVAAMERWHRLGGRGQARGNRL